MLFLSLMCNALNVIPSAYLAYRFSKVRRFYDVRPIEYTTFDEVSWAQPTSLRGETFLDYVIGSWVAAWLWLNLACLGSFVVIPWVAMLASILPAVWMGVLVMRTKPSEIPTVLRLTFGLHEIRFDYVEVGFTLDEKSISEATGRSGGRIRWEDVRGVTWHSESSMLVVARAERTIRLGPFRRWEGQRMAELASQRLAGRAAVSHDEARAGLAQLANLASRARS